MQKKSYKVLAYLCEQRPDFLDPHFQEVVEALLAAAPASLSAAKRNRLRCLKAAVLAMARPGGPAVQAGDGASSSSRDEATKQVGAGRCCCAGGNRVTCSVRHVPRGVVCGVMTLAAARSCPTSQQRTLHDECFQWALSWPAGAGFQCPQRLTHRLLVLVASAWVQMVALMVSEIILSVKERNKQTRATAFELLVQIAHAMHEAEPPPAGLDQDHDMSGAGAHALAVVADSPAGPIACRHV